MEGKSLEVVKNKGKAIFMDSVKNIIEKVEANEYARTKRLEMFNEYSKGAGTEIPVTAIEELNIAFVEENEPDEQDTLIDKLSRSASSIFRTREQTAIEDYNEKKIKQDKKIINALNAILLPHKSEEWRSVSKDKTFEEKLKISEEAMIGILRDSKVVFENSSNKLVEIETVRINREKLVEFHLRTNGISVVEVPPLSSESHFLAFEIYLAIYRDKLFPQGIKGEEATGIMAAYDNIKKIGVACGDISEPQEAINLLSNNIEEKWGWSIAHNYEYGSTKQKEDIQKMFISIGEMKIQEKTFDDVRSNESSTTEQIKASSKSLFEAQKKCFNQVQTVYGHEELKI